MLGDLRALSSQAADHERWLRAIRLFRRRELLRIAARDFYLGAPIAVTTAELATVADAVVTVALERIGADLYGELGDGVAILAFGKLGRTRAQLQLGHRSGDRVRRARVRPAGARPPRSRPGCGRI